MQNPPETPQKSGKKPQNQRAQREKISRRAEKHPREEKQPELPLPHVERKKQQRKKKRQQKQRVEHRPELRQQLSRRAQKIIEKAEHPAKNDCQRKLLRLKQNRQLHQPNSRPKKPPAGAASS